MGRLGLGVENRGARDCHLGLGGSIVVSGRPCGDSDIRGVKPDPVTTMENANPAKRR
jgi:hypothetical protein